MSVPNIFPYFNINYCLIIFFKVSESRLVKCLELGGHKTMLTCVDWSFANQCATCVTASQDGKIKISTLLVNSPA